MEDGGQVEFTGKDEVYVFLTEVQGTATLGGAEKADTNPL
jgi:hypothetical protein